MLDKVKKQGWRQVKFGDVVRQVKERVEPETSGLERYVAGDHMDTDDLRIRRWGEIGSGYLGPAFHMRFRPGQVLYGSRRTYLRKVAVADFDGICANTTFVIEPKNAEELLPEFLPFLMQTGDFNEFSVKNSKGSVNPYINFSDLARFEFALPPPEEQVRIVEVLRAATETVETQTEALDALEVARRSTIDHAFSMTHGWDIARLETVASMQNGRPFPGNEYGGNGVKLLRPGNLGISGYFYWGVEKTVSLDPSWASTASDFLIAPGDVVINLTAQSLDDGFMGRVCLAREGDESLLNQRIGRFRCNESALLPEYLFRALQTSRFRQHAHANCEGSKVKHLFWQHLAKYEIPIPPLRTQRQIAAQCAELDQAISAFRDRIGISRAMQSHLVNELMGEV
ncbi:TPA: restriction endonuclease subunit S [Pseudomonas aeruginosa]|uniref:restriction endonuclease subunit S n=1 Tax=Pseudomonas aeruginosa TaxID=287 RepID=UPI000F886F68|nr:restriction endonuclease subunit S [Pseudomonas aeruginosa]MCO2338352.1 restriction endonuclease subunit S [Pseudomonas aeruginosa]RUF76522.1 restriction endonuclease subunit S [Pseudomonas aeruginosa]HBO3632928.1 restriction endonuclease subunit S [Pseudomonas aeruginosa]